MSIPKKFYEVPERILEYFLLRVQTGFIFYFIQRAVHLVFPHTESGSNAFSY